MLIAWLEPPSVAIQGDQTHRTHRPAQALAKSGPEHLLVGSYLSPTLRAAAEIADGLVLCHTFDVDLLQLMQRRRRRGAWTIVEVNDQIYNDHAIGEAGGYYQNAETQALIEQLCAQADGLWFSSDALRAQHAQRGQPALTVLNAAPPARALKPTRAKGAPLRVGFAGSAGHAEDIASLVPSLVQLLEQRLDISLHIMAPRSVWPLLAALPPERITVQPTQNFERYLDFVAGLDVSLAPLLDTPFNRARSDIKFVEAAAMGVLFVGQQAPAYADSVRDGHNARTFLRAEELPNLLIAVADDPTGCARLVARARAELEQTRSIEALAEARRAFWREHLSCPSDRRQRTDTSARWQSLVERGRRETKTSLEMRTRYCRVPVAGPTQDLFVGLLRGGAGLSALRRARIARPSDSLVYRAEASATPAAKEALALVQRARQLAPSSDTAALCEVRLRVRCGDPQGAHTLVTEVTDAGSVHGPLWYERARLHLTRGEAQEAEAALRQALEHTPHLHAARELLCHLLCTRAQATTPTRLAEALEHAQQGLVLSPQRAPAHLGVARVLRLQGAWPAVLERAQAALRIETKGAQRAILEGHALCAEACVRLGQPHAARAHLAQARGA